MARYNFFSKKGRPTKVEKQICEQIKGALQNDDIDDSLIDEYCNDEGVPSSQEELETLYAHLTGETPIDSGSSSDIDQDYQEYHNDNYDDTDLSNEQEEPPIEKVNMKQKSSDINYDPFQEPVIERGYTKGYIEPTEEEEEEEQDIPTEEEEEEQDIPSKSSNNDIQDVEFSEEDLDIPEPDYVKNQSGFGEEDEDEDEDEEFGEDEDESGGLNEGNLEDLSPAQKRKSAEKTADAIIMMYCKVAPVPFEKWASINESTIQKLALNDRIDLNMELENDLTVQEYVTNSNNQVSEVFKVSDETKEEIKEPLIEVLLEQELALTPTQRLLLAVGSHIATMGFSAYQLAQTNKHTLEAFEKYHNEREGSKKKTNPTPRNVAPIKDTMNESETEMAMRMMQEMDNDSIDTEETDPSTYTVTTEPNDD